MPAPASEELGIWARRLERSRAAKDAAFRQSPESPIPAGARKEFRGLAFYDLNPDLRFRVPLETVPPGPVFLMEVSRGPPRRFQRMGYFEFLLLGTTARLYAFRPVPETSAGSLFVPFRDATSGNETYGGGRYLDVELGEEPDHEVDFNEAYHPYCAYSAAYSCPYPPPENWLVAPVRAGERLGPPSAER